MTVAGSAFAPHTSTTTRSPGSGTYAPVRSAASAAAPPGSATIRRSRQIARCASRIASSSTSTHAIDVGPRDRERDVAGATGAEGVGRDAADGTSTGSPASRAASRHRDETGSTPTTRTSPAYHAAMPADQAAAAHRDEHRVGVGRLLRRARSRSCPGRPRPRAGRTGASSRRRSRPRARGRPPRRRRSSRRSRARRRPARARARSSPRGRSTARRSRRDARGSAPRTPRPARSSRRSRRSPRRRGPPTRAAC